MATLTLTSAPFPATAEIVRPASDRRGSALVATRPLIDWATAMSQSVDTTAQRVGSAVQLTDQHAAIATTAVPTGSLAAGLYRVGWFARITTAAGVSSSLTVSVLFTHGGVACTISGAALTGNTTTTVQGEMRLLEIDTATPISYATSYASNAAGAMGYALDVVVERVS